MQPDRAQRVDPAGAAQIPAPTSSVPPPPPPSNGAQPQPTSPSFTASHDAQLAQAARADGFRLGRIAGTEDADERERAAYKRGKAEGIAEGRQRAAAEIASACRTAANAAWTKSHWTGLNAAAKIAEDYAKTGDGSDAA